MVLFFQMSGAEKDRIKAEFLYKKYSAWMYTIAYSYLHSAADAEDAVHEAFISIIKNIDHVLDVHSDETKGFLAIITIRKSIDIIRKRDNLTCVDPDYISDKFSFPLPGDNGLADLLATLNPRYREILLLKYDIGLSTKEIANLLGIKKETVNKLIWRAKTSLKKLIKEGENEDN